jgi:ankyrin repeat protein
MEQIFQTIINHDLNTLRGLLKSNRTLVNSRSNHDDAQAMIASKHFAISDPAKIRFFINTTPLHIAVYLNQLDSCQVLLENDSDINAKDNLHYTPLIYAAYCNRQAILKYLIERDADINLQDLVGRTALHWAARKGHLNCVKQLCHSQLSTFYILDQDHHTALDLAMQHNHQDVIQYFKNIHKDNNKNK